MCFNFLVPALLPLLPSPPSGVISGTRGSHRKFSNQIQDHGDLWGLKVICPPLLNLLPPPVKNLPVLQGSHATSSRKPSFRILPVECHVTFSSTLQPYLLFFSHGLCFLYINNQEISVSPEIKIILLLWAVGLPAGTIPGYKGTGCPPGCVLSFSRVVHAPCPPPPSLCQGGQFRAQQRTGAMGEGRDEGSKARRRKQSRDKEGILTKTRACFAPTKFNILPLKKLFLTVVNW